MARNKLAGSTPSYDKRKMSEASRKKKLAYDLEFQKKKKQVKKRVEANKANRKAIKAGTAKKGDKKDYDHYAKRMISQKKNRGRNSKTGGTAGDKRARG